MNRTDLQRVQFVDDGFPDAQDYANNYIVLPQLKGRASRPRTLRATLRLLRRGSVSGSPLSACKETEALEHALTRPRTAQAKLPSF